MRIIIALGGNALLRRGEAVDAPRQSANVRRAAHALAPVARRHQVVVTHGNGPQVGLLALQSEAYAGARAFPLDVLGAQTQGMIGYMIEDELRDELGPSPEVATLLTQVVVDEKDPAFTSPAKPVGLVYDERSARALGRAKGWTVGPDGTGWRRLVASPEPLRIVEINTIRLLVEAGVVTICAGGGGVPVVRRPSGELHGVEAVIDKDLCAALLASQLRATALLMLTDVDAVYEGWGGPGPAPIRRTTPAALRRMSFPPGSMAPKIEAACRFVERGDGARFAAIGALDDVEALLRGETGTTIQAD